MGLQKYQWVLQVNTVLILHKETKNKNKEAHSSEINTNERYFFYNFINLN